MSDFEKKACQEIFAHGINDPEQEIDLRFHTGCCLVLPSEQFHDMTVSKKYGNYVNKDDDMLPERWMTYIRQLMNQKYTNRSTTNIH